MVFGEGVRLLYKPKDLRVSAAFGGLVRWLNTNGLDLPLRVPDLELRAGYCWEEFIPFAPCQSERDVQRFYIRIGSLLRLFQLFEGRDFWLDNLVACGEQPVFVDFEMLLQPRRPAPPETPRCERMALELIRESVVNTGVLTLPTAVASGRAAEDLGALTPVRPFERPVAQPWKGETDSSLWTRSQYAPHLDGVPRRADAHLGEILNGYRRMHALLLDVREHIAAPVGPLAAFAGLPVRYIYRHTWDCQRIVDASTSPACLADRSRREALWLELQTTSRALSSERDERVIRHEIDCFRRLDIPYFSSTTNSLALSCREGELVADFFEGGAFSRLANRIEELASFSLEHHARLLETGLSTGPHRPRGTPRGRGHLTHTDVFQAAIEIGELIANAALEADGELAWLGITHDCFHSLRRVDVLPADMLSGTLGISIMFADLYAATGDARFSRAAHGALRPALWHAQHGQHSTSPTPVAGAFLGVGAYIYAFQRCGRALDCSALVDHAFTLAESLRLPEICATTGVDVVTGSTGLLLALLTLTPQRSPIDQARHLAALLQNKLATEGLPPSPFPPDDPLVQRLPDVREALSLAAARLAGHAHHPASLSPEDSVLRYPPHSAALSSMNNRKGCSLPQEEPDGPSAWLEQLERCLAAPACDREARSDASRIANQLLSGREATDRWFFDRMSHDEHDLSVITGLPALVHAFLRLKMPGRFGSIRRLEI